MQSKKVNTELNFKIKGTEEYSKKLNEVVKSLEHAGELIEQLNKVKIDLTIDGPKQQQDKTRIDNKYENAYDNFDRIMNYEFNLFELFYYYQKMRWGSNVSISDIVTSNLDNEMLNVYSVLDDLVKTSKM